MTANSVPDRPFALLSDAQLAARIHQNLIDQGVMERQRNAASKRVLAQLKRRMAELVAERNLRADMQTLPF